MSAKIFHISDILSVYTGVMVTDKRALTQPDGTIRPAYRVNVEGIIDLIAHVSGNSLRNPANSLQYDMPKMMHLRPHVQRSLGAQFPWLKNVQFPDGALPADRESAQDFCDNWVRVVAEQVGESWFAVDEDPHIGVVHTINLRGPRMN